MNKSAAILILASFLTISIFGIFSMAAPEHHSSSFNACVGSLTQGAACPNNDPIASSIFHLNSFKFFSNSPLESGLVWLFAITSLLIAAAAKIASASFVPLFFPNAKVLAGQKIFETSYQPFKREKIFWNSLHENSPSTT